MAGAATAPAGARRSGVEDIDLPGMVAGIRREDPEAMTALYTLMQRGVRCLIQKRMAGRQDHVEDRVHEVYLITVRAIREGRMREPEHLAGFVRTVAVRQVCEEIRRAGADRRRNAPAECEDSLVSAEESPEERVMQSERVERMRRTLRALRPEQRDVLIRFYLKGEPPDRICREMNLSQNQFRLLKSRAKARFGLLGRRGLERSSEEIH